MLKKIMCTLALSFPVFAFADQVFCPDSLDVNCEKGGCTLSGLPSGWILHKMHIDTLLPHQGYHEQVLSAAFAHNPSLPGSTKGPAYCEYIDYTDAQGRVYVDIKSSSDNVIIDENSPNYWTKGIPEETYNYGMRCFSSGDVNDCPMLDNR